MRTEALLFVRLRRAYQKTRKRGLSIIVVEATGMTTLLLYLVLLPDQEVAIILSLLVFTGIISGAVASNNTAKVYVGFAAGIPKQTIASTTLRLFLFELSLSVAIAMLIISRGFETLDNFPTWNLLALGVLSSGAALIAFTRNTEVDFIRYNYVRAVANMLRAGCVFWATAAGRPELLGLIFLTTSSLPFVFGAGVVLSRVDALKIGIGSKGVPLLREYLVGLPAGATRAFVLNGLVLVAVETLTENEARFLRLLLIPKDVAARCFNAALPLVFDRMYAYRPKPPIMIAVFFISLLIGAASYVLFAGIVGFSLNALPLYLILFAATMQVYIVLPFIWRVVHKNRAIISTGTVVLAALVTYVMYWALPPSDVNGFIGLTVVYYVVWLVTIWLLLFRERQTGKT